MNARMGTLRGLCLGAAAAMVTAGLGVVATPQAHAADAVFPAPDSGSWLPVSKAGAPVTDATGELDQTYLDVTPAGGTWGTAAGFVSADLQYAYFRLHVAALPPAGAAGAYVVQFDTNSDVAGWERAMRYEPTAGTVSFFSGDDSAVNFASAIVSTLSIPTTSRLAATSADGGAYVGFALTRGTLASAGINVASPMVLGATTETAEAAGAGLNAKGGLLSKPKADILGAGKVNPSWSSVASDPLAIDSDGDAIPDNVDNCPIIPNPGQEDDDKALDNALPPGSPGQPDGTEGKGNVCDATPRGYDPDGDDVGYLDDQCKEQYGLLSNGCPAQSTTLATLRYVPKTKVFKGTVRADFDQCQPRRTVTVFKSVSGPDKSLGTVKSSSDGRYKLALERRAKPGTYYSYVDPKWTLGARCFGVRAPKIKVG